MMTDYLGYIYWDSGTTGTAWTNWNGDYLSTATGTTTSYTWTNWNSAYSTGTTNAEPVQLTSEQIAEVTRQQETDRAAYAKAEREREEAQQVAERLLLDNLTPEELDTYTKGQYILVKSDDGKRTYKLMKGRGKGADLLGADGKADKHYCFYVPGVPDGDDLLARKLALQYAEDEAIRRANMTIVRRQT